MIPMASSSKRFKDVFEFVRRIKASSGNRVVGTPSSSTNILALVVPSSVRKNGFGNCRCYTAGRRGLQLISAAGSPPPKEASKMIGGGGNDGKKPTPPWPRSIFRRWGAWILGFFATVVLPFWRTRMERIQKIEGEAEFVVKEVDKVAKVVEKVAVVAEKVSEELAEMLPENSKLQKAAIVIENMSKVAAADAALAENIIHKVEVLEHDFQELEKAVRPVISKDHSQNQHEK